MAKIIESDEFVLRYNELSDDEQAVLSEMLRRLEFGRDQYGPLVLSKDKRKWHRERRDEGVDWLVYDIAESLQKEEEGD